MHRRSTAVARTYHAQDAEMDAVTGARSYRSTVLQCRLVRYLHSGNRCRLLLHSSSTFTFFFIHLHWSNGQSIQKASSHILSLVRAESSHGIHSYLGNLEDQAASAESLTSGSEHALPLLTLDGMAELHGQNNMLVVLCTWLHCFNHAVFFCLKLCPNGCAVHTLPA